MIVPINLERLSGDGYKMNANSPLVTPPSYITHAQLRYTPFTSAEAIQGTFVTGANSTVEFDVTGANLTRYLKLYISTDGTTYNEVKSWGGTDGIRQKEYLVYSALLTQSGTNAPVATILENTLIGTPTWNYLNPASYSATLTGGFTVGKTMILPSSTTFATGDYFTVTDIQTNLIEVSTSANNSIPTFFNIEIRVYP